MKSIQPKNTNPSTCNYSTNFHRGNHSYFFGGSDSFFKSPTIQAKLTVSEPNDKYEQEADTTADKVVQRFSNPEPVIQNKYEDKIQTKPIVIPPGITPFVQAKSATFENIQCKFKNCEQEEDKTVQRNPDNLSSSSNTSSIENSLSSSKGSGNPLPDKTRNEMESSFGTDFSNVKIHDDNSAVEMSKSLNAQAFTHGSDIYFNSGKYNTASNSGKHLLAHELTHTIQQNNFENKIQKVPGGCPASPINVELIPNVMDAKGWAKGASFLRKWLRNPSGGGPADTTTITMDWILGFSRAKTLYDSIFSNKLYSNEAAKAELIRLFTRLGLSHGDYFHFSLPITQLDPLYYINHVVVDSVSSDILDDLSASLGRFDLRILVAGKIGSTGLVEIENVGIYTPDSFDFTGFQFLGCWNTCIDAASTDILCDGERVYNSDFRNWRAANGRGGDYLIYSDIKIIHLPVPESFMFNPVTELSSTFEINSRLVSQQKFHVASNGGIRATIRNCDYLSPRRSALASDRIAITLYKEGIFWNSEIGEKILRTNQVDSAVWVGLEPGSYYIAIVFYSTPVQPYESVMGDIDVETFD